MRRVLEVGVILSSLQLLGCGGPDEAGPGSAGTALPGETPGLPGATPGTDPNLPGAPGSPATTPGVPLPPNPELAAAGACTEPGHFMPPRLIRLSHSELKQHIQTALPGVSEDLLRSVKFQADHLARANARGMSGAEFGLYFSAAKNVANAYAADSPELAGCRAATPDASCPPALNQAVERLYRRPIDAAEWEHSTAMFQRLSTEQGATEAAAAVLAGALIAPQTLHHSESGDAPEQPGVYRLTQRETLQLARYALTGPALIPQGVGRQRRSPLCHGALS